MFLRHIVFFFLKKPEALEFANTNFSMKKFTEIKDWHLEWEPCTILNTTAYKHNGLFGAFLTDYVKFPCATRYILFYSFM